MDGAIIKIIEHDKYEYGFTDYIYYFFPGVIFMIDKKIPFDDTDPLYNVYINKVFNYRIKEEKFIEEKWKLSEILSVLNNEIVEDIFKKYSIDYEL